MMLEINIILERAIHNKIDIMHVSWNVIDDQVSCFDFSSETVGLPGF